MNEKNDSRFRNFKLKGTTRSVVTLLSGNSLAQAITLAGLPLLSRIYAPEEFGALALYVAISTLFSTIASGRYHLAIVIPESVEEAMLIRNLAYRILFLTFCCTLVIFTLISGHLTELLNLSSISQIFPVISVSILLVGLMEIQNYWFTRARNFRIQSQARVLLATLSVFLQFAFGKFWASDALSLVLGLVLSQLLSSMFLLYGSRGSPPESSLHENSTRLTTLMRKYWKMPLLNGPNALVDAMRINGINIVLGGISQILLGQFSMALRMTQAPVGLIGQSLSQVFLEKMAREGRGKRFSSALMIVKRGSLVAALPFLVLFAISPRLFPIILGDGWTDAGLYAQALAPWLFLNVISSPLANVFIVTQTQGRLLVFALVYMALPVSILYLLRSEPLTAIRMMSASLTLLLLILVILALLTARKDDGYIRLEK